MMVYGIVFASDPLKLIRADALYLSEEIAIETRQKLLPQYLLKNKNIVVNSFVINDKSD